MQENPIIQNNQEIKPKKKHRFLKFLLFLFLTIIIIAATKFAANHVAESRMNEFLPDHPYILYDDETRLSVRNDFELLKEIDHNGKIRNISWKENSKIINLEDNDKTTHVNITAISKPSKVFLTATYKTLLIGKAERTYEIQILPESTIATEDVNIVDVESVKEKTYDKKMTMVMRDDGTVASMYGEFKQKIYHTEDALVVLNAYKSELGFPEDVAFKAREPIYADTTTYLFDMVYNDVPISNSVVHISVNDRYELKSIKCNFSKSIEQYMGVQHLPKEDAIDVLGEELGRTGDNTIAAVVEERYEEIDGRACLITTYVLFYSNGEIHTYEVNATTGTVIGEITKSTYLLGESSDDSDMKTQSIADAILTNATGKGERGDTKEFEASHIGPLHLLHHPTKKITAYSSSMDIPGHLASLLANKLIDWGAWLGNNTKIPVVPDLMKVMGMIDGLVYGGVETIKSVVICDVDNHFNVPLTESAVDSYCYINNAYDYFLNRFDRWSYDNNGAPIRIFTNFDHGIGYQYDNASWNKMYKSFYVNPSKNFKYTLSSHPEVLGHEYTHAVFGSYSEGGGEIKGLNEAYADIFGILMSHPDKWQVGDNVYNGVECYVRDLENINSAQSIFVASYDKPAPEKYHDENWEIWNGEEHAISCMIGHIAYQMYVSGAFSQYELESIWYKSLTYGYSGDDNFVTCRQQIIQAMKELNFSPEQRNLVRGFFDEAEIFDETDIYECEPAPTEKEIAYEELTQKLQELNPEGDSSHRFAVMIAPIGFILNKVPIYIYEESVNPSNAKSELIGNYLNQYWIDVGGKAASEEIGQYVGQREGNAVEYKQVSSLTMNAIELFFGQARTEIANIVNGAITDGDGEEETIAATIIDLIFMGSVSETSRHDFLMDITEGSID